MIHTQFELAVGDPLVLIMVNGTRASGIVRWIMSDLAGIQFDQLTPLSTMLDRECFVRPGMRRRMPRLIVTEGITVIDATGSKDATICDISLGGTRFKCNERIEEGRVQLRLPKMAPIGARVIWTVDGQYGCVFDHPFAIDELTRWLLSIE